MKLTTLLIGGAALVGLGIYLSRKFKSKNEDDDSVFVAKEQQTYGEKLHKASLFAVGAIKTGADKLVEGIKDITNQDMVKKGEETIDSAKEVVSNVVEDIKDMTASINIKGNKSGVDADVDVDLPEERDDYFNQPYGDFEEEI